MARLYAERAFELIFNEKYLKKLIIRASAALEFTYIDIVGPISPIRINEKQYLINVTDDKIRTKQCYTLKRKNEAFGIIKMHIQRLKT